MRIARVLHAGTGERFHRREASSDEPSGDAERAPVPTLALERDGALYAVAELDRRFRTRFADGPAGDADFHRRVVALGGEGLAMLDERLVSGERPGVARILPAELVWLAPCDADRCA